MRCADCEKPVDLWGPRRDEAMDHYYRWLRNFTPSAVPEFYKRMDIAWGECAFLAGYLHRREGDICIAGESLPSLLKKGLLGVKQEDGSWVQLPEAPSRCEDCGQFGCCPPDCPGRNP